MKEYIKKFESALDANDYAIVDIPFTSTIGGTLTNLTCNQENKKIVVDGDSIDIVDAAILYTLTWNTEGYAHWGNTPSQAAAGEIISTSYTVRATPNAYISINDSEMIDTGESSGTFTFTMPAKNTTVLLIGGGG